MSMEYRWNGYLEGLQHSVLDSLRTVAQVNVSFLSFDLDLLGTSS